MDLIVIKDPILDEIVHVSLECNYTYKLIIEIPMKSGWNVFVPLGWNKTKHNEILGKSHLPRRVVSISLVRGCPAGKFGENLRSTQSPNIWAIYNDLSRRERSPQMVVKSKGRESHPQNGLKLSQGFIINCPETLQVPKMEGSSSNLYKLYYDTAIWIREFHPPATFGDSIGVECICLQKLSSFWRCSNVNYTIHIHLSVGNRYLCYSLGSWDFQEALKKKHRENQVVTGEP